MSIAVRIENSQLSEHGNGDSTDRRTRTDSPGTVEMDRALFEVGQKAQISGSKT
jgi:hypothetical protein